MAPAFIERVGVATLYPASPEIPNLFSAYVGDPNAKTDSGWDTPSGEVYSWRWTLGRRSCAFYTALIRRRPTWIRWSLLPAILRLCGVLYPPEELYEAGQLSADAYRIAQALEAAAGALSTGELREQAGFPRGSSSRAAYLKAVEELETRLLSMKVFLSEGDTMHHTLVLSRQRACHSTRPSTSFFRSISPRLSTPIRPAWQRISRFLPPLCPPLLSV